MGKNKIVSSKEFTVKMFKIFGNTEKKLGKSCMKKDNYLLVLSNSHRVPVISLPCRVYVIFDKVIFLGRFFSKLLPTRLLSLYFLLQFCSVAIIAQSDYVQQKVDYSMDLQYVDSLQVLNGNMDVNYHHHGSEPLDTLYFHLWMNAFKNNSTPFAKDQLKIGRRDFYFADEDDKGYYKNIEVKENDQNLTIHYKDESNEVAYIVLSESILSGESKQISFDFELKLPRQFSRTGFTDQAVYLHYFYPKLAVYDASGWHTFPYLNLGEFYSNFGDYTINIELPEGYSIAHSGSVIKNRQSHKIVAEDVIDVALVASKEYKVVARENLVNKYDEKLGISYFGDDDSKYKQEAVTIAKDVLSYMNTTVGILPLKHIMLVPAAGFGGGMEFPGLITVSGTTKKELEYYITHELIHQWFYGRLATNERDEPWLDEGITHYYTSRYLIDKYGEDYYTGLLPGFLSKKLNGTLQQHFLATQSRRGAYDLSDGSIINYGLHAYVRPGQAFKFLEDYMGVKMYDKVMQEFYANWNGSHPNTQDLQDAFEKETKESLDWFFDDLLKSDRQIDYCVHSVEVQNNSSNLKIHNHKSIKAPVKLQYVTDNNEKKEKWLAGFEGDTLVQLQGEAIKELQLDPQDLSLDINRSNDFRKTSGLFKSGPIGLVPYGVLDHKNRKEIMLAPFVGFNEVDKLYLGAALYNSGVDFKPFKYLVAPAYAFGSKNIVGHAMLKYNQVKDDGPFEQIEYRLPIKSFSFFENNRFDYNLQYWKIDPSIRFYRNRNKASNTSYLELRYIHLIEEYALLSPEGFSGLDRKNSSIYQLGYHSQSLNALGNSYSNLVLEYQKYTTLGLESDESYLKLTGDISKEFYYSRTSAISMRLFGSYFLTNTRRESSLFGGEFSRGSVAIMNQGQNDYLYEEYFLDRVNQTVGFNQISGNGGGFKNALGSTNRLGLTNDYAFALNIEAELPFKFLPINLFGDLAYYSTKSFTNDPLEGEWLYSGGIAISNDMVGIYLPLFYSSSIDQQYQSQDISVLNRITFRFDLHRMTLWDKVDHLNF